MSITIRADGTASAMARVASMPLTLGHADVHQDDVRRELLGRGDGGVAVLGLADDLDAVLVLEDHRQAAAEQGVVVADHDPDGVAIRYLVAGLGLVGHPPERTPAGPRSDLVDDRSHPAGQRVAPRLDLLS